MIDLNLGKQVVEIGNWFISFPQKLVEAVMGAKLEYLDRRERIEAAKELAALREVGKSLQNLYWFKGNIYWWINELQTQKEVEDADQLRLLFSEVATQLDDVWQALQLTPVSNFALGAETSRTLALAKVAYKSLSELSDEDIFGDRGLVSIIAAMEDMEKSGEFLIRLVDGHRATLDGTHS